MTLKAKDDAGHEASSETKIFNLPERPFANPLARALVEQRRMLAIDANSKGRILDLMDAITLRPEDTFDQMAHYLGIMSARSRLALAKPMPTAAGSAPPEDEAPSSSSAM